MEQASFYCPNCRQMKLFMRPTMSHTPHILASVFLCGLWLPIWVLIAITDNPPWHCSFCGFSDNVAYLADPNKRERDRVYFTQHAQANQQRQIELRIEKERRLEAGESPIGVFVGQYKVLLTSIGVATGAIGIVMVLVAVNLQTAPSTNPTTVAQNTSNKPAATPTPELNDTQRIARAKTLISESASNDELNEAVQHLKVLRKGTKEFREGDKLLTQAARIILEREVIGPKPISSPFDGGVSSVKTYLSQTLNDYDSSEFLQWGPVQKVRLGKEPYWSVQLRLRAKNAFGAMIVKDTTFYIRQGQVVRATGL